MSMSTKLINSLKQLSTSSPDYNNIRTIAKEFFGLVYKIGIEGHEFTEKEKSAIGSLLESSLPNLQFYLSLRVDDYDSHSGLIARYDRSSLQFLLDDYKDYPTSSGEKLDKYLFTLIDSEDLEQWNNFLKNYVDGEEDAVLDSSSEEYLKIPKSHWWWQ